jgi:uncharacterized protein YndB with AHSA1/START domain
MTRQKSFKRLVRTRMEKTGESYTAARASLLGGEEQTPAGKPVLATSDGAIRERTGRGWEEWFDLLDEWGAADRSHRDIARWVAERLSIEPLAWNAQAIAISYERARGGRAVGQHPDGFTVTVSRTVAVPVDRLFDAFSDPEQRQRWLPGATLRERTATRPRSARFDWEDGETRVTVAFDAKDEARSTAALAHARLPDAEQAERMRAFWRERFAALKSELEAGAVDA